MIDVKYVRFLMPWELKKALKNEMFDIYTPAESLFLNIIQSVLMHLCHRGKISKITLCLMIGEKWGL
jgi:hypothetical protein